MKRSLFTLIIACLLVFSCLFSVFAFADTAEDAAEEAASMRRIDGDGYLYYMDYTGDYYSSEVMDSLRRVGYIDPGCSTFFTHNLDGEPISCRNYDIRHSVSPEDPTLTGLNFVLHCKPEGKYESIALADAIWCAPNDPLYRAGGPDLEGFDSTLLDILPYQCMDGLNEKGLFVSIMRVNIKEGDQPGRFGVAASMLVRYMLDDCADVEEAIAKIDTAIVTPEDWQECHIFVSDAQDHYALIESRNSVVSVIDTDVVTNFYLGSDDMEDYYSNGVLREEPVAMIDKNGKPLYHFGYGHGYHRFVTIASQLDRFRKDGRTMMPEASALVILRSAVQSPYTEVTGTSMTQYSAIYNNAEKTVSIWPFQNYETEYKFDISGKQMTASAEEPVENHGADSERIGIIGAMDIEVNTLKEAAGLAGWSPNSEVLASLVQFVSESVDESHEGYIPPEDRIAVFDFDGTLYGEGYFQPMLSLVRYLYENGYSVYICSGSDRDATRVMTEGTLDQYIPTDHVIGTDFLYKASRQGDRNGSKYTMGKDEKLIISGCSDERTVRTNKAIAIQREIGKQPVLAFGNSSGDFTMADYALQNTQYGGQAYMLLCDDTVRDYGDPEAAANFAARCEAAGYHTVSMRDDFLTIYGEQVHKSYHPALDFSDGEAAAAA